MDKGLYFKSGAFRIDLFSDLGKLPYGKLPGIYHSLCAEIIPELKVKIICGIDLGRDMNVYIRTDLFRQHEYSGIRYDKRVRSYVPELA